MAFILDMISFFKRNRIQETAAGHGILQEKMAAVLSPGQPGRGHETPGNIGVTAMTHPGLGSNHDYLQIEY